MRVELSGHFKPCVTEIYLRIWCAHGRLYPHAPVHSLCTHYGFLLIWAQISVRRYVVHFLMVCTAAVRRSGGGGDSGHPSRLSDGRARAPSFRAVPAASPTVTIIYSVTSKRTGVSIRFGMDLCAAAMCCPDVFACAGMRRSAALARRKPTAFSKGCSSAAIR